MGLAWVVPLCVLAAVMGSAMVLALGVVANPGVVVAVVAMALGHVPWAWLRPLAAPRVQALAQAGAVAAAVGAGQALLLPMGIPFALGRPELVGPMFVGAALALLVDGWLMWRLFGGAAFPAAAAWPQGSGVAAAIRAGAVGERPGVVVLLGAVLGAFGAVYRAPMAGFGVALFGDAWALGAFAAGVLVRAHGAWVFGWGVLMRAQVPQGMLVGAVLVAVGQMALRRPAFWVLARAGGGYLAVALVVALAGGLQAAMPWPMLGLFVAFAGVAALAHGLAVAVASMQAGWAAGLAAALAILVLGMQMGFPAPALCLLAGYAAATGPGMVAMGQALKVAHELGGDAAAGRQQAVVVGLGFVVAAGVVLVGHGALFGAGQVPPAGRVFAVAIQVGGGSLAGMALWVVVGAAVQVVGGGRHLGVMLATGLLLLGPAVGWAVALGLAVRGLVMWRWAEQREAMALFGAGVVAGDALATVGDSVSRTLEGPPRPR